ncbi:hypothetical protein SFRURICE_019989 [Spodoptera frugiperda]|nr:hypothetical protein SFRURICE_019989 [Spodoptera frugiperda]
MDRLTIGQLNLHNDRVATSDYSSHSSPPSRLAVACGLQNYNWRDVNASSSLWYGKVRATDMERRCAVEEFIAEMNLSIHNTPDAPPTFCSQMGESCIDVTLSSSDATDFTRKDLSAEEGAEIMSDTFTYCADIAFGRGSLTSTRRCDWWNNYLVEQLTGFAFDEALIAFRVARSRYRASVERAKGNLLRRVVQRLESEGPWSPLYHEFKANRSVDLAFVQNIKVNNVHTTGIEETTEVLLDELIPDDVSETDSDYHQQIRSWAAIPPNSPVSDLPSINELVTVIKTLPMN